MLLLRDRLGAVMGKADTSGPPGNEVWPLCMLLSALVLCYCTKPLKYLVGHAVAQLIEALRYKPNGRGFDSRWCH